jgi:hypothetical protein
VSQPFLVTCQRLWAAFVIGVMLFATVVTVIAEAASTVPAALPGILAAAIGLAGVVIVVAIERTFAASPPTDDRAALTEYRMRLILQAVVAETSLLAAVVLTFVFGPSWVAAIGGVGAIAALVVIRPTRSRLARLDAAWASAGADVSLLRGAEAAAPGDGPDDVPADPSGSHADEPPG